MRIGNLLSRAIGGGNNRDPLAQDFKPDIAAIEEAPIPISIYSTLYVVIGAMVVAVLWSVLGKVDRIVVAEGRIVTTPGIVMQPFTTSKILRIHVRPGDHVRKGDVLVTFDPAFAQADQSSLEQKLRALNAEIDRIHTELSGQKTFVAAAGADAERREQGQLFVQRMSQFASEVAVRDSREHQIDAQIDSDDKSAAGLTHQLELAHKVADIRRELQSKNAGSLLEVMGAERDEADLDVRLKTTVADAEKLKQQRAENTAERQSFLDRWRGELNQRLVAARQEQAQAADELSKARKLKDFTQLTAPVDAVVLQLADRSEGSVLREAETLITLVPDNAELKLEADIPSRDVGFVAVGDQVRVKFEAYPFQQFGTLNGTLDVVSPDSLPVKEGERSNVVFRARVRLKEGAGDVLTRGIHVRPGLIATAEIKAGERSIASYILDPLVQTFDESAREP